MVDGQTIEEMDRFLEEPHIVEKLVDGEPAILDGHVIGATPMHHVWRIVQAGQTLFEGTKAATQKQFALLKNHGLLGSSFFEMGAGV